MVLVFQCVITVEHNFEVFVLFRYNGGELGKLGLF